MEPVPDVRFFRTDAGAEPVSQRSPDGMQWNPGPLAEGKTEATFFIPVCGKPWSDIPRRIPLAASADFRRNNSHDLT
jgi:hypothetical protein